MAPPLYPLPSPEDRASAEAMAAGAAAMMGMAQVMDEAATLMLDSGHPQTLSTLAGIGPSTRRRCANRRPG